MKIDGYKEDRFLGRKLTKSCRVRHTAKKKKKKETLRKLELKLIF